MTEGHWQTSRKIVERILVCGKLELETPCSLGNGDSDSMADMPIALDPLEGCALLTGTSIAGALRSYLREREFGYGRDGGPEALHNKLFGRQDDDEGEQSWLITCDSLGDPSPHVELRDGVALNPKTRTAENEKKFDFELLEAGTHFKLRFELLIPQGKGEDLLRSLVIALQGLENGEIALGARKRRGLGQCRVTDWKVACYDLTTPAGLLDWLNQTESFRTGTSIAQLLGVQADLDQRESFSIDAVFRLDGSLLIRSSYSDAGSPDSVHLRSNRKGVRVPILSGTSLAGALRARALRIAKTVGIEEKTLNFVDELFGRSIKSSRDIPSASRVITAEKEVVSPLNLIQNRIKIDRFTGGSFPTALFSEQPVWGQEGAIVTAKIDIQQPSEAHIGLMLLLLKDLWTGDLPLGGEIGVGRGRLKGQKATLTYRRPAASQQWVIEQRDEHLHVEDDRDRLEHYVSAFVTEMQT